jgi:hypothetical protein
VQGAKEDYEVNVQEELYYSGFLPLKLDAHVLVPY